MIVYTVRRGDSLARIARRFSADPAELARLNGLHPGEAPVPGLALCVPGGESAPRREAAVCVSLSSSASARECAEAARHATFLCSFGGVPGADGTLAAPEDAALRRAAEKEAAAVLLGLSNLSGRGGYSGELAHALLADGGAQEALLARLLRLLDGGGYAGASLCFQYVYPFDREPYGAFVRRAAAALHARGYFLLSMLAPQTDEHGGGPLCAAQDAALHGELCDRVLLLGGAPPARDRAALERAVRQIPREKLLLGLSGGGTDRPLDGRGDARPVPVAAAEALARAAGAEIRFDTDAEEAVFRYRGAAGGARELRFADLRTLRARLALAEEFSLGGVGWHSFPPGPAALALLETRFEPVKLL